MFAAAPAATSDPFAVAVKVVARRDARGEEDAHMLAVAGRRLPAEAENRLAPVTREQLLIDGELLFLDLLFEVALSLQRRFEGVRRRCEGRRQPGVERLDHVPIHFREFGEQGRQLLRVSRVGLALILAQSLELGGRADPKDTAGSLLHANEVRNLGGEEYAVSHDDRTGGAQVRQGRHPDDAPGRVTVAIGRPLPGGRRCRPRIAPRSITAPTDWPIR